ncbi:MULTISPECIES: FlgD immunoglobulin-like domain containing protein [unclassified Streptomyces]|uniref:FlgD immunoglobulin-like domain containing protein n=1 Tax=unclassified Streptomyces TaxID=2593676 RepID=UPI00336A1DB0
MNVRQSRLRRSAALAAAVLTLASGVAVSLPPATAQAADATEVVIPSPDAYGDRAETLLFTGANGVLHQEQGSNSYLWTNTYNRRTVPVKALDGVPRESIFSSYDELNRVAYATTGEDGGTSITLLNIERNTTATLRLPDGYAHPRVHGGFVLASRTGEDGSDELRVLRPRTGGTPYDVQVRLPADATAESEPVLFGGEGTSLLIRYRTGSTHGYGILDGITGAVTPLPVTGEASSFRITRDTVTWFSRQDGQGVRVLPRDGTTSTPRIVPLTPQSPDSEITAYTVGRNVLWHEGDRGPLRLTPIDGAETPRVLLTDIEQGLQGGDSTLTALGRDADGKRTIHGFTVDGSGLVFDQRLREVTPVTLAYGSIEALGLDRGTVRYVNALQQTERLHGKDVGTALDPSAGDDLPVHGDSAPGRFADGGDEGLARLVADPDNGGKDVLVTGDDPDRPVDRLPLPASDGRILDVSPEYVLYQSQGPYQRQYVIDIVRDRIVEEQAVQAAALDYSTLWTASPDRPGTVIATDLRTGKQTDTVSLGASCTPEELQSNGTLLYWSCPEQGKAGVQNPASGRAYSAPAEEVLLGDGFIARYNDTDGALSLTGLGEDGTTTDLGTVLGVKSGSAADSRGVTWAVDRRAGKLAYVDRAETVHVFAPQHGVSALSVPDRSAPATWDRAEDTTAWRAQWWLSKPAASWKLTLHDPDTDTEVRTWTGDAAASTVKVSWDGTTDEGATAPDGAYTWILTAAPADGRGETVTVSGTLAVTGS